MAVITCPHCGKATSNEKGVCLLCDKLLFAKTQAIPRIPPAAPPVQNKNLIACKDCGAPVSRKAKTCPQCGAPVPQSMGSCSQIVLIFFVIGVVGMVVGSISNSNRPPLQVAAERAKADEVLAATECYEIAKKIVTKHLKSPTTAKFPSYPWNANEITIKKYPNQIFSVESHVDSQNGFGAMIRSKWLCFFSNDGKTYELKYLNIEGQIIGEIPMDLISPPPKKDTQ